MPKKERAKETEKQKKLLKLISENIGISGSTKSMYQMMIEAGYSESSAHQQSTILVGIKDKLDPIVQAMTDHREKVLEQMAKKLPKAHYHNLIEALDKLTKNIQLLSGKATERPNNVITGLENLTDEQLDELIKDRKNRTG
jgi:phage terminase small subunit